MERINPLNSTNPSLFVALPWLFTAELLEDVAASEGLTDEVSHAVTPE